MSFEHILPPSWRACIQQWLADDCPTFDVGGFVVGDKQEEAWLLGKTAGVLAGKPFFDAVFEELGCTVVRAVLPGHSARARSGVRRARQADTGQMAICPVSAAHRWRRTHNNLGSRPSHFTL